MRLTILNMRSRNVSRVALIAFAAASFGGCSSDTGRFGSDPIYTGSTPNQRAILGRDGGQTSSAGQSNWQAPQPPAASSYQEPQPNWGRPTDRAWSNVDTTGSIPSNDVGVSRQELAAPNQQYAEAVAKPARPTLSDASAAPARVASSGWTGAGGSWVTLQPGENVDTLSRRYSVPSTAIRSVNNYGAGGGPLPGERVLIPVYNANAVAPQAPAPQAQVPAPVVRQVPTTVASRPAPTLQQPQPQLRAPVQTVPAAVRAPVPQPQARAPVTPPTHALTTGSVQPPRAPEGGVKLVGEYTVRNGDTLASIARRYGCSEQALRDRNNLRVASVQPGQRLMLPAGTKLMLKTSQNQDGTAPVQVAKAPTAVAPAPVKSVPTQVAMAPATKPAPAQVATTTPAKPAPATQPRDTSKIDQHAAETIAVAKEPTVEEATGSITPGSFRWPVRGRVISEYGSRPNGEKNEGINLAVPEGTSVKAADDGEVIYSGNELKGYGNLVLIRHANGYVTAYAHASELLVNRGDKISRGQIIARAGATGSVTQPQLHFELRKGQKPIDPKPFLASN